MKRVAVISFHTCPLSAQEGKEIGGMNVYVLELSKELAKLGYVIDVFTRDQDDSAKKIVQVTQNFRVIHLPAGPQKTVDKKDLPQYLPEFVKNFFAFIQKENNTYDILHCHYYLSGLIGGAINEKLPQPLPLLMTFHTLALMKNLVARTQEEQESKERIDAEFLLMQKAKRIISPSKKDAEYMRFLYGASIQKICVVTPGVNTHMYFPIDKHQAKQQLGIEEKRKLILFVGRIEPLKGIDILLYATKIMLARFEHQNISLFIVGGDTSQQKEFWPEELQKLEEIRSILDIKEHVEFLGRKKPEELPTYYNAADIVVMPSHYESFGMTSLEAMACGTPVITTDVSGITDITDQSHRNLLITTANNPLLLASKMHTFLHDTKTRDKISHEILQAIPCFDWSQIALRVQKIYQEIV